MADGEEIDEGKQDGADDAGKDDGKGKGDGEGDGADLAGMISIGDFAGDGEGDEEGKEKGKEKPDAKKKDEGKGAGKKEEKQDDAATLKAERDELLRKNKDLNRALHTERAAKKEKNDDKGDEPLTESQLLGIMAEYKDDPKTLLNVIKYQAEQAAKKAATGVVGDADVARKKKEIDSRIHAQYPGLLEDGHPIRLAVDKANEELGLKDHPYAELLGTAVTFLSAAPNMLKEAYDKGRKDERDGAGEKKRQDLVEGAELTPKGKPGGKSAGGGGEINEEVAKRLNMSKSQRAIFKKLTSGKGSKTISVEG